MKTVTVQLNALIQNFSSSMIDFIGDHEDVLQIEDDTECFLRDLRNLMNPKRQMAATTLRRLFSDGYSMMLLPATEFDFLETAYNDGDEFSIVIKDGQETLCILCKNEIHW